MTAGEHQGMCASTTLKTISGNISVQHERTQIAILVAVRSVKTEGLAAVHIF